MILDASAVLAILRGERGADEALAYARGSAVGAVNLGEVLSRASDLGIEQALVRRLLVRLEISTTPFTERQAQISGELRERTRSGRVSLADRACLAVGIDLARPIVTADHEWAEYDLGQAVELIFFR